MEMQKAVGQLCEAVNSLKDQGKERDRKLDDLAKEVRDVSKDVHAAKVTISVVGALILLIAGFIAWMVNTYISTHPAGK